MHGACCHERDCYAGESHNAAALMVNTFAALAADPTLSHGQALQSSILTMINSTQHSEWADPKYGALRLRQRTSQAAELRAGGRTLISSVAVKSGQFIKTRPKRDQLQSDPRKSRARIYFI